VSVRILSGLQPWWWMVLHLDKRVENRSRPILGLKEALYRGEVLLHASKSKGSEVDQRNWWSAHDFVAERFGGTVASRIPKLADLPMGGIVGRATVVGRVSPYPEDAPAAGRYRPGIDPRWHIRLQHGYLLDGARETPFVPWRGWQGPVQAPADLLAALESPTDPLS